MGIWTWKYKFTKTVKLAIPLVHVVTFLDINCVFYIQMNEIAWIQYIFEMRMIMLSGNGGNGYIIIVPSLVEATKRTIPRKMKNIKEGLLYPKIELIKSKEEKFI